jgi:hypothetical protein
MRPLRMLMRRCLMAAPFVAAAAVYALDRGIFIGSADHVIGQAVLQKKCRYLFITGVSEIPARGSILDGLGPPEVQNMRGLRLATGTDNLYCRMFGD